MPHENKNAGPGQRHAGAGKMPATRMVLFIQAEVACIFGGFDLEFFIGRDGE